VPTRHDEPIGRESELGAIAGFLDRVETGPFALVLSGPAGIGKSTIWRAAIAEGRRRGYRTLVARGVEAEAELAFAGLADLLEPVLDDVAGALPGAQRLALEVALQRTPDRGTDPSPLAISLGAAAALRQLASAGPVLVAVDDPPWLDGPSARVLDFVVRRVGDLPVGFLPAIRATPQEPVAAIPFAGSIERLVVGPLGIDAVDALLRRDLALALPRPDLAWVHRESRGNPFFALELGRAIERTGARPGLEVAPLATDQEELVRSRLGGLPEGARLPLGVVAATSQPSVDLVLAAYPEAASALDAAVRARVLELDGARLRFSHPLLASGAYSRLDPDERRRLHERLAAAVSDAEQRARHLALASTGPDPIVAVELDTAAEHARRRGAPDTAGELALKARDLTPPSDTADLQRRTLFAAGAFIQAGDPDRARAILEEYIARSERGPALADAVRILADVRSSDDWEAKLELLDRALEEAGSDHGLRSRILEARSQALYFLLRDARESLVNATDAVIDARRQDDPSVLCSALASAMFAQFNVGDEMDPRIREEVMSLADKVERLRVFQWPAFAYALTEVALDRLDSADRTLATLHRRATQLGDWDSLPNITAAHANVAFRMGRWHEARALARDAERGSRQNGQRAALSFALSRLAMIEWRLGNESEAGPIIDETLEVARSVRAVHHEAAVHVLAAMATLDLGDATSAERELRQAGELLLREGYLGPFHQDVLAEWADALVAAGRFEEATTLITDHEAAVRGLERPAVLAGVLRAKALAAAATGDEADAEAAFVEALTLHERVPAPFERARTLLAYGESLRRARQRGRARAALTEASAIFAALPAPRWLARAQAELERTGHRAPGARLSPTEQQVADLVVAGRTNREVAEALFMSPHTVEAHLTRIYQSLGVRGRTELAAALRAATNDHVEGQE
jgi:DNA-binding CsgD family transcriptional regulator